MKNKLSITRDVVYNFILVRKIRAFLALLINGDYGYILDRVKYYVLIPLLYPLFVYLSKKDHCLQGDSYLFIRTDVLGDHIVWFDVAKSFRESLPNKKLILLTTANLSDLAAATGYYDEILTLPFSVASSTMLKGR